MRFFGDPKRREPTRPLVNDVPEAPKARSAPPLRGLTIEAMEPRILLSSYELSTLGSFEFEGNGPSDRPVIDSSGNLFGTTPFTGPDGDGTVWEIARGSTTITTLASFNGTNGDIPQRRRNPRLQRRRLRSPFWWRQRPGHRMGGRQGEHGDHRSCLL